MIVDASTLLFFDASCLIAAAASPDGGSGFLLSLCERRLLTAVVSMPVLAETAVNLQRKFPASVITRHVIQIAKGLPQYAKVSGLDVDIRRYPTINPKDEHVLVVNVDAGAHYILTLDKPLADEINSVGLRVRAVSPGELIKILLPNHPAFAEMRDTV